MNKILNYAKRQILILAFCRYIDMLFMFLYERYFIFRLVTISQRNYRSRQIMSYFQKTIKWVKCLYTRKLFNYITINTSPSAISITTEVLLIVTDSEFELNGVS